MASVRLSVLCVVLALLGLGFGVMNAVAGEEKSIKLEDVPDVVKKAAEGAVPGIVLEEAEVEIEDGKKVYELEGEANGKEYEIEVAEDGTVLEIEADDDDDDVDDDDDDDDDD